MTNAWNAFAESLEAEAVEFLQTRISEVRMDGDYPDTIPEPMLNAFMDAVGAVLYDYVQDGFNRGESIFDNAIEIALEEDDDNNFEDFHF